jgi:acyl-CoA hydrolase
MEKTSFLVMSPDCNHTNRTVFGGKVLAEIDKIAFIEVLRWLEDEESVCNDAVTYLVENVKFDCPAYIGDIVYLSAEVKEFRNKSITVEVKGRVWRAEDRKSLQFCSAKLVFISKKDGTPSNIFP